jgi:hypothetical protein
MITQSNSQIFSNTVFGLGTDMTTGELTAIDMAAKETYLASSSYSNLSTKLPTVPSNQRIAKGS